MNKKKVVCAGHVCIDITPAIPDPGTVRIEDFLTPGKLIQVGKAQVSLGGCVSNTGLGMKVLGAEVLLMGKIGNDAFGDEVENFFRLYDAQEGLIRQDRDATSYTIVLAVPGIDRIFLHHPGANDTFCEADIPWEKLSDAALFHIGYPPLMRASYLNGGSELKHILSHAKSMGAAVSLDLAAVDPASEAGRQDWKKILEYVLPDLDIFCPSIEELCYMLEPERFSEWKKRADRGDVTEVLDLEKDIRPLADRCMELGCRILLLKCGAPGLYLRTGSREKLAGISPRLELDAEAWADKDFFEESYVPEKILSATGAGDTSIAAFLTALLRGYSPEMTMHLAAAEGACCVAAYDSLSGLKSLEELKERIENGWEKNHRD